MNLWWAAPFSKLSEMYVTALHEAYKLATKVNDIGLLLMASVYLKGTSMVNFSRMTKSSAVAMPQWAHNLSIVAVEGTHEIVLNLESQEQK